MRKAFSKLICMRQDEAESPLVRSSASGDVSVYGSRYTDAANRVGMTKTFTLEGGRGLNVGICLTDERRSARFELCVKTRKTHISHYLDY